MHPADEPLLSVIDGPLGFATGLALDSSELAETRQLIEAQWLNRLHQCAGDSADEFAAQGISRYHELAHRVDHHRLWPKKVRVLPQNAVEALRSTPIFRILKHEFGAFLIADEEDFGRENVYWRIVRPNCPADVGPLHADCWFWELGHGKMPPGRFRVKVWISIVGQDRPGLFEVVPGSHLRDWQYHGEARDGIIKPRIDEDVQAMSLQRLPTPPGTVIVFHDRLLHRGVVHEGSCTRVSLEFTILARKG